jgi:Mg/Co/Ni transporter MgtE
MPPIRPTVQSVQARAALVLRQGERKYADLSTAMSAAQRRLLWEAVTTSQDIEVFEAPRGGHRVRLRATA